MTQLTNLQRAKEEAREKIMQQLGIDAPDGSYLFHLTRVKSAFGIGTMSLDDFKEIENGDEWLDETCELLDEIVTSTYRQAVEVCLQECNESDHLDDAKTYINQILQSLKQTKD